MRILVDADACPVVKIVESVAKEYNIAVILFSDTNHQLKSDYSEIVTIGSGADAVDLALIKRTQNGDIVVTQDYGVAALALGKGAYSIHQSGKIFNDNNIDGLLMDRHLAKKARMSNSKHHLKGPKKRTSADDLRFENSLRHLIMDIIE